MIFTPSRLAVLLTAALYQLPLHAETEDQVATNQQDAVELGEIEIWSTPFAQSMGTQKIDRIQIENMPVGNGTVSELLKNNPAVQYSSRSNSQSQGEIAPDNVSFHGERFYNNSWLIDGLSNNDNINPGANAGSLAAVDSRPFDLPDGGTQSFWINADLIESVEVYDSNISAKYGQFTGGVVDANLVSPDTYESWGSVSYRTTRDSWTSFHFDSEEERNDFEDALVSYNQPRFTKHIYSVNANQPLSEQAAILFSYNRTESEIPTYHDTWQSWEDQTRLAETYLVKGLYEGDNGDRYELGFIYSPHESTYVQRNVKDGNYALQGGGYRVNFDWDHSFTNGKVVSSVAYKSTVNSIDSRTSDSYNWVYDPDYFDWQSTDTSAQEGGYGDTETVKDTITLKQDYELEPKRILGAEHKLSLGWQTDFATARYERKEEANIYISSGLNTPSTCYDNDPTCIAGSQYADTWVQYTAGSVEASNNHYSAYLQDQLKLGQLEISAGIRGDYDEFLGNFDIAPRLTLAYDLFNNSDTMLFGGVNRYYSDSLLAYALSEEKGDAIRYSRSNYADGWVEDTSGTYGGTYISTDLDTPYSDEINLGIQQRLGNTVWTFKWVKRQGKDQFVRENLGDQQDRLYVLTNDGYSDSDSFILSGNLIEPISWHGVETYITLGANYINNNSTFTSYDPGHDFSDESWVYDGNNVISIDELISRNSYNIPWTVFTNIEFYLPDYGLTWSQDYRIIGGYRQWENTGEEYDCSTNSSDCSGVIGNPDIYQEVKYNARFVADWHIAYRMPIGQNEATVSVDILNVTNSKVEGEATNVGSQSVSYQPGRRFWLNLLYRW